MRRPSVVFPLPGRPEITTKGLRIRHVAAGHTPRGATIRQSDQRPQFLEFVASYSFRAKRDDGIDSGRTACRNQRGGDRDAQ
jgi:hypothetical protein